MIEVSNLSKYYGDRQALAGISFRIEKGEIVGLLGLNGAGKSTALKILAGYLLPTAGEVRIDGIDVVADPERMRARIGFLPEVPPLYPEMTPREFLTWLARLRAFPSAQLDARVASVLDRTALTDRADDPIQTLSLGYRKRVGIAQAIVHNPALVILDEPISGLDPQQIKQMRELIRGLGGEHTVLISSHILTEVEETCDDLLMLDAGRVVAQGTEAEILALVAPGRGVELSFRAAASEATSFLTGLPGVVGVQLLTDEDGVVSYRLDLAGDTRESIASAVVGRGWGLRRLDGAGNALESVFLTLTGRGAQA